MDTLDKIINVIRSFEGRKEKLNDSDFNELMRKMDALDVECLQSIVDILKIDKKI